MNKTGQTVLITGATAGIGYEFAKLFASDGFNLVLVSRDEKKLTELTDELSIKYHVPVSIIPKDLSQPGAAQAIWQTAKERNLTVDVLVNNAGFGMYGQFINTPLEEELNMITVNIIALTALTKLFLPGMIERKYGKILQVASTAAFQPGPRMSVYFATKAYVLSFSEALATELRGTGVTVTTLCPGPTKTNFSTRAGAKESKVFSAVGVPLPDSVARTGYIALQTGKRLAVVGTKNKLLIFLLRLTPRPLVLKVVEFLQAGRS